MDNKSNKKRVFLGGTCNNSEWRNDFIDKLEIDFYNPVVKNWTEADYKRELEERETCDYVLYILTPKAKGFYSPAEVADDSNKRPEKTIFSFIVKDGEDSFDAEQIKSLKALVKLLQKNGAKCFKGLEEVAVYLNSQSK